MASDTLPLSLQFFGIILLVGGAAAWGLIELRVWRGKPILPYEPRRQAPWSGVDLLMTLAVFFVVQATGVALAIRATGLETPIKEAPIKEAFDTPTGQVALLATTIASFLLTSVFAIVWITARRDATGRDFGLDARALPRDVVYGLVAFFAAAPVVYLVQVLFVVAAKIEYDHPLVKVFQERSDPVAMGLALAAAVVVAPLAEEFLVRVLLQGWLEKVEVRSAQPSSAEAANSIEVVDSPGQPVETFDPQDAPKPPASKGLLGLPLGAVPIWISSLVFALMHWGQGAAPVPLFLYALVLGFLYQRTHRLLPCVVAHFALNAVSMAMLWLSPVAQ